MKVVESLNQSRSILDERPGWYLSKFPDARVIAIEPDPDNFALLELNCRPYGDRVALVQAALWSKEATLNLQAARDKDAISVSEKPGLGACRAVSMQMLIEQFGLSTIDIFKCDIEGAELAVFSNGCDGWLTQTRCIVIETHGKECLESVVTAAARNGFQHGLHRNVHFFYR